MRQVEILDLLEKHKISTEDWGKGESKTMEHLLREIGEGESHLVEIGELLVRVERGLALNIFYFDGLNHWKLVEEKQVFKDGRVRTRGMDTSVGGKMKQKEAPFEAARRTLSEELGIKNSADIISRHQQFRAEDRPVMSSTSFPGLYTKRFLYLADVSLPKRFFRFDGYIEHQPDKDNYLVWQKAV